MGAGRTFVWRVRGGSMVEEQMREGDRVVVEGREDAHNGEAVVALIEGDEVTLKP